MYCILCTVGMGAGRLGGMGGGDLNSLLQAQMTADLAAGGSRGADTVGGTDKIRVQGTE